MKSFNQSVYHLAFLILMGLISEPALAQHQSPCERFAKGHTRPNFHITSAVGEEQSLSWAKYYEGLQFSQKQSQQYGTIWEWTETYSKPEKRGGNPRQYR